MCLIMCSQSCSVCMTGFISNCCFFWGFFVKRRWMLKLVERHRKEVKAERQMLLRGLKGKQFTRDKHFGAHVCTTCLSLSARVLSAKTHTHAHTHIYKHWVGIYMDLKSCEIIMFLSWSGIAVGGASEVARHNRTPLCEAQGMCALHTLTHRVETFRLPPPRFLYLSLFLCISLAHANASVTNKRLAFANLPCLSMQ